MSARPASTSAFTATARAVPPPGWPGLRSGLPRRILDAALHRSGFAETRADRMATPLVIHLGPPGALTLAVIDRRSPEPRTYRFETGGDVRDARDLSDLGDRFAAVAGGRRGLRVKIVVDPAACFLRSVILPRATLPRMRAVLAEDLAATTPFRADAVYSDWFVEGEDVGTRALHVRHVVLKAARLDPLLDALARAGLAPGPVTVGSSEAQTLPVDVLSQGHRALPALFGRSRTGDLALVLGAVALLAAAYWGWRGHQDATLAALDAAFAEVRRQAGPAATPAVQAALATIEAGRAPDPVRSWDALAAALPDGTAAEALHLDRAGARVTLLARDESAVLAALDPRTGFGPPVLREAGPASDGLRRLVVVLPGLGVGR